MLTNSAACLLLALATLGADGFKRTWTDTQGQAIEGSFVRLEGEIVVIRMADNEVKVPLERLSVADKQFARSQAAARGNSEPAETTTSDPFSSPASVPSALEPVNEAEALPFKSLNREDKARLQAERVWTDNKGVKLKASFVRMHEGNVVLRSSKIKTVPFYVLSAGDQAFLRSTLESVGMADEIPDPTPELLAAAEAAKGTVGTNGNVGNFNAGNANAGNVGTPNPIFDGLKSFPPVAQQDPTPLTSTPVVPRIPIVPRDPEQERREAEAYLADWEKKQEQRRKEEASNPQPQVAATTSSAPAYTPSPAPAYTPPSAPAPASTPAPTSYSYSPGTYSNGSPPSSSSSSSGYSSGSSSSGYSSGYSSSSSSSSGSYRVRIPIGAIAFIVVTVLGFFARLIGWKDD